MNNTQATSSRSVGGVLDLLFSGAVTAGKIDGDTGVRSLLDAGARIDYQDNAGISALMIAAGKGYKEVVQLLLNNGANIYLRDKGMNIALTHAADKGHTEVVQLLVRHTLAQSQQ